MGLKAECLSRMIFFGEKSLRRAVAAFLEHYHAERNHQGLDNQIIEPGDEVGAVAGTDRVPRAARRDAAVLPSQRCLSEASCSSG